MTHTTRSKLNTEPAARQSDTDKEIENIEREGLLNNKSTCTASAAR
jgi:hypothetical protein